MWASEPMLTANVMKNTNFQKHNVQKKKTNILVHGIPLQRALLFRSRWWNSFFRWSFVYPFTFYSVRLVFSPDFQCTGFYRFRFFGTEKRTVAWTCSRHEHNDSYPIFQTFEHDRNELFLFADSKHFPESLAWEIHLNFAIVNNNIELYQIPA